MESRGIEVGKKLDDFGDSYLTEYMDYVTEQSKGGDRDTLEIVGRSGELPFGLNDDGIDLQF
jgi:hypothetical protein